MSQLIQNASTSLQFTLLSKSTICVNLDRLAVPVNLSRLIVHNKLKYTRMKFYRGAERRGTYIKH